MSSRPQSANIWVQTMADSDFRQLSRLVYDVWGIKLPPAKKTMVSSRLTKRVLALGFDNYHDYISFILGPEGKHKEWPQLIDAISTNKTDFFRENHHFNALTKTLLPQMARQGQIHGSRPMRVWSAGCSSGEEPYTLAMVLAEFERLNPWFRFQIVATDINNQVLSQARKGIYPDHLLQPVPKYLLHRYMMKGSGQQQGLHRVVPELRQRLPAGHAGAGTLRGLHSQRLCPRRASDCRRPQRSEGALWPAAERSRGRRGRGVSSLRQPLPHGARRQELLRPALE